MSHDWAVRQRFRAQGLTGPGFSDVGAAVAHLGAAQGQELADSLWSLGLRVRGTTEDDVRAACDRGDLLRTHVLRPTWHLVTPRDVRWLQTATADRVRRLNGTVDRSQGIDEAAAQRASSLIVEALAGGRALTRPQLGEVLAEDGVPASGSRLAYLVMRAELDQLVCSGPALGKHQTYALLAERAPDARVLDHDVAVVELARRFLTGHGPASVRDLARWSSLTMTQARAAVEQVRPELAAEVVEGVEVFWSPDAAEGPEVLEAHLLPGFDEAWAASPQLGLGASEVARAATVDVLFYRPLVVRGRLAGFWRRDVTTRTVTVEFRDLQPLSRADRALVHDAADRYAAFIGRTVSLVGL